MPDAYAALTILCGALLFAYADRMSERVTLAAILAASVLFHTTQLVVAVVLILFWRRRHSFSFVLRTDD